jgi:hypothetical protein
MLARDPFRLRHASAMFRWLFGASDPGYYGGDRRQGDELARAGSDISPELRRLGPDLMLTRTCFRRVLISRILLTVRLFECRTAQQFLRDCEDDQEVEMLCEGVELEMKRGATSELDALVSHLGASAIITRY